MQHGINSGTISLVACLKSGTITIIAIWYFIVVSIGTYDEQKYDKYINTIYI